MFRVFGSAQVLSVARGQIPMSKSAHRVSFDFVPKEGMVYVRSRAISSRCNDNFDYFGPDDIAKSYQTFIGKPVFVNHVNSDHRRARGLIIDAALHRDINPDGSPDTWAEVLMEIDALTYPKLGKALLSGAIDRTSMGTDVQISKCSICHNEATNPLEYCLHIPSKKGKRILTLDPVTGRREDKLVYEICIGLNFFENSLLVEPPADPTAFRLGQVVVGPGLEHLGSFSHTASVADPTRITPVQVELLKQAAEERPAYIWGSSAKPTRPLLVTGGLYGHYSTPLVWDLLKQAQLEIKAANWQNELGLDMQRSAYGETKAPTDVDTLRDESCPVCGNDTAYAGRECQVCGYVSPPKVFGDPDVDKAKQLDTLKQDIDDDLDTVDPSRNGAPIGDAVGDEESALEGDDPASPDLECTNCGTGIRPAVPQTSDSDPGDDAAATGPTEGDPCPVCGKGELAASSTSPDSQAKDDEEDPDADPDDEDQQPGEEDAEDSTAIGDGKLPASKNARAPKYREHHSSIRHSEGVPVAMAPRPVLAAMIEQQKIIDNQQAYIASLMQRDAERENALASQATKIQRLTAGLTVLANHLGPEVLGQVKVAMIRKRADEQNPAQPVPEPAPVPPSQTTLDAKTPEAFADVTAPGMVPGSNQDVAADAVSTAYTPGTDIPSPGVKQLVDVTAPVDGTQGPRPINETRTEVNVRTGNPMNPQVAYPVNGPFAQTQRTSSIDSDSNLRQMASIRLARLRIAAGIAPEGEDDLSLGARIASNSDLSMELINVETATLNNVTQAASRKQGSANAPRGLVPRSAGLQRTVPAMGSATPLSASASTTSNDDEDLAAALAFG